jgi:recombination protein RecA
MSKNNSSKFLSQLRNMEGAVDKDYNPFDNVIRSGSPSLDWIYGKGMGLPLGFSEILFGPPKSGKSLLTYMKAGNLHQNDPEAIVIKFNTEMREAGQIAPYWGIDPERYIAFDVNEPELIFNRLTQDILPMVQGGLPVKYIIIDSIQGIQGLKEMNSGDVTQHLIGDHAQTVQKGLKQILPMIRRQKIALTCTAHVRANVDIGPGGKGPETKMGGAWALKHFAEYFVSVNRAAAKDDKVDIAGEKFETDDTKDLRGNKEQTGHKIWVKMEESSVGVAGRAGQFTLSYENGLINTDEEIFKLGAAHGLIDQAGAYYTINGEKFQGKAKAAMALREDLKLQNYIMDEIRKRNKG